MPFKHEVIDNRGHIHKRTSAERQYLFAVVRHTDAGSSFASWSSSIELARKESAAMGRRAHITSTEVIPCTPIGIGKHKGA